MMEKKSAEVIESILHAAGIEAASPRAARDIRDLAKAMQEVVDDARRLIDDHQIAGFYKAARVHQRITTLDQLTARLG